MSHNTDCSASWEPDTPCTCRPLHEGETVEDVNKDLRWEREHQRNEYGVLQPTSHAPGCPAQYEPDLSCNCGFKQ